ncbi:MAG: glucosidase family protein [Saccharofermentanales bacterium]
MEQPDKHGLYEDERQYTGPERLAAYHSTITALCCGKPCGGLFTYNLEDKGSLWAQFLLAKIIPYIEVGGRLSGPSDADNLNVYDIPGGIIADYKAIDNSGRSGSLRIMVKIEMFPLLYGREEKTDRGGAVYRITTTPAAPVVLKIGGGKVNDMVGWKQVVNEEGKLVDLMTVMSRATMVTEKFRDVSSHVRITEKNIALLNSIYPYTVTVKSTGTNSREVSPDGGEYLESRFDSGSGMVAFSFDRKEETALSLVEKDTSAELASSRRYYDELMETKIETPSANLDFAFRSAIYNLDYSYLAPLGWIEAIHHWMSIWHQQHTLAADWLGQEDRSKDVITSQSENLYPDGAAPMFEPNGNKFRGFGGTDHFFMWQVRHYLRHTNDIEFAKQVLPHLETVVTHCFNENDPDGLFTLHWGEQIGNQEDYLSHLHISSTPSIEAVNMLESLAEAAAIAGQAAKSRHYYAIAGKSRQGLKQLWNDDLGRFIYQVDTTGKVNLDGQYQTYIYPTIYGMVDEYDSYTSIRHLRDRLIGEKGEVYCSNNFPNHMTATLGTQAGAAQQPWGAMGLAAAGFNDEAIKPLEYIADIVAAKGCDGSWPECAEPSCSYFSPPAGVFVQAVIEAVFGLTIDLVKGTMNISPCFPFSWNGASLSLPKYKAVFNKNGNSYSYRVSCDKALTPVIKWRLPYGEIIDFRINGIEADFKTTPCVNGIFIDLSLPASCENEISFIFKEKAIKIDTPRIISEGSSFEIQSDEFVISGIVDRSSLSKELNVGDSLKITLKDDILSPYMNYGKLGLMNFSRRTIFLKLKKKDGTNGGETIYPFDFTILPAIQTTAKLTGSILDLTVRNNAGLPLDDAILYSAGQTMDLNANDTGKLEIPDEFLNTLLPGKNESMLILPGGISSKFNIRSDAPVVASRIELPAASLIDQSEWKKLKRMPMLGHMPWLNQKDPMFELEGTTLSHPDLPIEFTFTPGKFAPVSWLRNPRLDIPLDGEYRKFYIMLFPILDNHDVFSPVLRITAKRRDLKLTSKEYYYPGDLDNFWGLGAVGCFSTANSFAKRSDGLLPMPDMANGDWSIAKPHPDNIYYFTKEYGDSFPQSSMWSDGYMIKLSNSIINIIEFDLQKKNDLTELIIESVGTQPAFGIVAIQAC